MSNTQASHFLTVLMSVIENTEGDSDAQSNHLEVRIGDNEMALIDRMVVSAGLCGGEVSVTSIPVFDSAGDDVEAVFIADKDGYLSLSSHLHVKHAWPIEIVSDGILNYDDLKAIARHTGRAMTVFVPNSEVPIYATPTDDLDEADDFKDLVDEVMAAGYSDESLNDFKAAFEDDSDLSIEYNPEAEEKEKRQIFVVSGRELFGSHQDDDVVAIEAFSEEEASDRFKRLLQKEARMGEMEFEEGSPAITVSSVTHIATVIQNRLV